MIRKTMLMVTLLCLSFIWTGCIEVRMETELKKDGSGKGRLTLAVSPTVTKVLSEVEGISDMPETPVGNLAGMDENELKDLAAKTDVKIKGFKSEMKDGRKTVSFKMEFDSLEDYSWVLGNVFREVGDGYGVFAGEEGQLVFKEARYDYSSLMSDEPEDMDLSTPSDETMDKYLEMMGVINGDMGAIRVIQVIKVPGDVIETDATAQDGRTCTWDLDFATIRSDKESLKPRIVFSSKGLKIEPLPDQEF